MCRDMKSMGETSIDNQEQIWKDIFRKEIDGIYTVESSNCNIEN